MEVKVFSTEPVIEVVGVKYHHHPNGGGLIAEIAQVAETAYIGPFVVVRNAVIQHNACIEGRIVVSMGRIVFENETIKGSPI